MLIKKYVDGTVIQTFDTNLENACISQLFIAENMSDYIDENNKDISPGDPLWDVIETLYYPFTMEQPNGQS